MCDWRQLIIFWQQTESRGAANAGI